MTNLFRLACLTATAVLLMSLPARAKDWDDCLGENYTLAVEGCGKVISSGQENAEGMAEAHSFRGWAHYWLNQDNEALADFDQALTFNAKFQRAIRGRGMVFYRQQKYEDALKAFDAFIKGDPQDASMFVTRSYTHLALRENDKAVSDAKSAVSLDPSQSLNHKALGIVLYQSGKNVEAQAAYDSCLKIDSKDIACIEGRGWAQLGAGNSDLALFDFESAIKLNPGDAKLHYAKASAHLNTQKRDEALIAFNEAIRLDPKNTSAYTYRGYTLALELDHDAAIADFDRALAIDPQNLEAMAMKADALYDTEQFDAAMAQAQSALAINPSQVYPEAVIGFSLLDLGRTEEALAAFERAIEIDGNNGAGFAGKGRLLLEKGELDAALTAFETAIRVSPGYDGSVIGKGDVLLEKGDTDGAIAEYNRAISMSTASGKAYLGRGRAYAKKGDHVRAKADLEKSLTPRMMTKRYRDRAVAALASLNDVPVEKVLVPSQNQKRVALVIGNGRYQNATPLINPTNDAKAIASKLSALGFDVISGEDLDLSSMQTKLRAFAEKASVADVAMFYYAGHGMQVGESNYLMPVDVKLESAAAVDFELVDVNTSIVKYLGGESKIGIIMLDSCRNNPLARSFKRSFGKTRDTSTADGLAPISTDDGGLLVAFATAPGDVAEDGEGANSPFTTALLKHMATPGLELEQMMKRVKRDVFASTDKRQQPWVNSALRDEIFLVQQ